MNIARKYKISKLLNQPLIGVEKEIIDFIDGWLSDLDYYSTYTTLHTLYYMNKDKIFVFEVNYENKRVYFRLDGFFDILYNKYKLSFKEVSSVLKIFLKERFDIDFKISDRTKINIHWNQIEAAYKNGYSTKI